MKFAVALFFLRLAVAVAKSLYVTQGFGRLFGNGTETILYEMSMETYEMVEIGPITANGNSLLLNGLNYDFTRGVLYGHTSITDRYAPTTLLSIDTTTAEATLLAFTDFDRKGATGFPVTCPNGNVYIFILGSGDYAGISSIDVDGAYEMEYVFRTQDLDIDYPKVFFCRSDNTLFVVDDRTGRFVLYNPQTSEILKSGDDNAYLFDPENGNNRAVVSTFDVDTEIVYGMNYPFFAPEDNYLYITQFDEDSGFGNITSIQLNQTLMKNVAIGEPDVCSEFFTCEPLGSRKRYSVYRGNCVQRCVLPSIANFLKSIGFTCGFCPA